ncbi:MAG: Spy/CpxP family protein refolding chaperone [Granulosicoccus sp.]
MKPVKTLLIVGVTVATLAVGATAFAKRQGGHSDWMLERVSDRLELDEGQLVTLTSLRDELMETRELMRGDEQNVQETIKALVKAESFDQEAALSMINERVEALRTNAPELINAAAVFFDGLSAEQKADVESFIDRVGRRHQRD